MGYPQTLYRRREQHRHRIGVGSNPSDIMRSSSRVGNRAVQYLARVPLLRLFLIIAGALVIFQSSDSLTPIKLAYFALLLVVVTAATHGWTGRIFQASALAGLVLAVLTVWAIDQGATIQDALRDSSTYFMLLFASILAIDFGRQLDERVLWRATIMAGFVGSYGWIAEWMGRREIASLPQFGLPSSLLVGLAISATSAQALTGNRPARWWAATAALLGSALLTGTRNAAIFALAPLVIVAWSFRHPSIVSPLPSAEHHVSRAEPSRSRSRTSLRAAVVVVPIFLVVAFTISPLIGIDRAGALARLLTVFDLENPGSTASLVERQIQQDLALTAIREHPLIGSGPGTIFEAYRPTSNITTSAFTLDTSLVVPAKWGIVGTLVLALVFKRWWALLKPQSHSPNRWGLTALGLAVVLVVQGALTSVVEDKGLWMALMLLGAGTTARRGAEARSSPPDDAPTSESLNVHAASARRVTRFSAARG